MAKYNQEFDKFATELEDEFVDEFAGVIGAREVPVRNQSVLDSPERKRIRLERLRTVSRATPMQRRTLREDVLPSIAALQNIQIDTDAESNTSSTKNN
jgi:hypothetical protein